jgi:hypothetical protein
MMMQFVQKRKDETRLETVLHPDSGQTPDFPATHAAVATVAPFPAWRGSQGLHCAEPGI